MRPRWAPVGATVTSTSTVTTTSSSDDVSDEVSESSSREPSPVRTNRRWNFEELEEEDTRIADKISQAARKHRASNATPSIRALPRCGLVNFKKEGDTLRWAPRMTQNCGGVAARVHNFEDAFSLEEFSSRALPMVWQATGGDPRCSSSFDDRKESSQRLRPWTEGSKCNSGLLSLRSDWGDRMPSGTNSDHPGLRRDDIKYSMGAVGEMRRPSFWSALTHHNQSDSRGRLHLRRRESVDRRRASMETGMQSGELSQHAKRHGWGRVMALRLSKAHGRERRMSAEVASEETMPVRRHRRTSLLRRIVPHFERHSPEEDALMQEIRSKRFDDRNLTRNREHGEQEMQGAIRLGRKHRSVGRSQSREPSAGATRRIRSSLDKLAPRRMSVNPDDDQYVTFMTPMS